MMQDDELDALLRDARRGYHAPPEPPLEAMWKQIERAHFDGSLSIGAGAAAARMLSFRMAAMAAAAALVVGVGMGWWAASGIGNQKSGIASVVPDSASRSSLAVSRPAGPVGATTSQYLGETVALLAALSSETRDGRPDREFVAQAGELLSTTRLLLDSQAASNPELRNLLEDLELVLAQIARLPARRDRAEIDIITKALEQRDVVPRLRSVVAGIANSDN